MDLIIMEAVNNAALPVIEAQAVPGVETLVEHWGPYGVIMAGLVAAIIWLVRAWRTEIERNFAMQERILLLAEKFSASAKEMFIRIDKSGKVD